MKFVVQLLLASGAMAADPVTCDPTKLVDGCATDGSTRCQVAPDTGKNTCVDKTKCGTGTGADQIQCSMLGQTCAWDSFDPQCGGTDFMCATNDANKNTCVPKGACGTDPVTCTQIGATCDSSAGTGCTDPFSCATAPTAKKDKCVPTTQCDTTVAPDTDKTTCAATKGATCDPDTADKGCGEGKRCATAPPDLKNTCVASEACGTKTGDVETTCGAAKLAAGLVAAFAVASTL